MHIKNVKLKNFRNYDNLDLNFNDKVNIIIGDNAQGKTNLVEALYLSSFGKSFRTKKDKDLIKFNKDFSKIEVFAKNYTENVKIEIIFKDKKKFIKKSNKPLKSIKSLLGNVIIVEFSPEDLKIVKEEPSRRRIFIDKELCQISPKYYNCLSKYKKVLIERNAYLKEKNIDSNIIDIYDMQLSNYGSEIIKKRKLFIERLNEYSKKVHYKITDQKENLEIKYNPNINIENGDNKKISDTFYDILKKNIDKDLKLGTTTIGCHKDDFSFVVNGINMREFGSQGQQRTCSLSIKLAELDIIKNEKKEDAILILDDVMSELDKKRQEFLIEYLKENQVFITTTHIENEIIDKFPQSDVFFVKNGIIEKNKINYTYN